MEFTSKSPELSPASSSKESTERKDSSSSAPDSTYDSGLLPIEDWGCIDYSLALQRQMEEVEKIASQNLHGKIIFCTHPSVVTVGRATQDSDIFAWEGPIVQVSRGGRATYHGPEQIVIYPLVNLKKARRGRTTQDIAGLMRDLEQAIVASLLQIGVPAVGKSFQKNRTPESQEKNILPAQIKNEDLNKQTLSTQITSQDLYISGMVQFERKDEPTVHTPTNAAHPQNFPESSIKNFEKQISLATANPQPANAPNELIPTGVWIRDQKVASLGLAVRQWVSFHGAAINFEITEFSFQGIHPCGYRSNVMTSIRQQSNISRQEFEIILKENILRLI